MRQNARAGLETLTRDIEMAGYQTTSYGDLNKTGLAITLAADHEIEMDQQRVEHTNGTIDWANPVYEPKLVYYHLATDMRTGRQNLYRQIRTQPGLRSTDEIVAENISDFTLAYLDKNNKPVDCLTEVFRHNKRYGEYTFGMPRPRVDADYCRAPVAPCTTRVPCNSGLKPDPLKNIRRIQVSLTTVPAGATTLAAAATAGDATITVASTAGFPASGKLDVFTVSGTNVVGRHPRHLQRQGRDAVHGVRRSPGRRRGDRRGTGDADRTGGKTLYADGERDAAEPGARPTRRPRTAPRPPSRPVWRSSTPAVAPANSR